MNIIEIFKLNKQHSIVMMVVVIISVQYNRYLQ